MHPRKTSPSSSGSSHRSSIPCSRSRGSHRHSASRGGGPFNGDSPTLGYPDSSLVAHSPDTAHRHGGQDPAGSERRFSNGDSPTLGHPDYSILVPSPGSAYQHGRQDFADSKEEGSGANVPYDHRRSRHGASPTNLAAVHRPSNPETSAGMPRPDSGALDPFREFLAVSVVRILPSYSLTRQRLSGLKTRNIHGAVGTPLRRRPKLRNSCHMPRSVQFPLATAGKGQFRGRAR